jgi:hypothetical protein
MAGILEVLRDLVKSNVDDANAIVEEVQKSRVNVGKVVHEIRKDDKTTDAKVKAFQAWLEKATAAINDATAEIDVHIKTNLVSASAMDDKTYEAKKVDYKLFKSNINDAKKLAKGQPGYSEALFAELPSLLSLSTGKESGSGSGTGTRRPRLTDLTVNDKPMFSEKTDAKDGTVTRSYTFTAAALFITKDSGVKVTASELSGAAFETVGSDNLSDSTSVEFEFTVTDKKDVTHKYSIVAIPSQTEDEDDTSDTADSDSEDEKTEE